MLDAKANDRKKVRLLAARDFRNLLLIVSFLGVSFPLVTILTEHRDNLWLVTSCPRFPLFSYIRKTRWEFLLKKKKNTVLSFKCSFFQEVYLAPCEISPDFCCSCKFADWNIRFRGKVLDILADILAFAWHVIIRCHWSSPYRYYYLVFHS